MKHSIILILPFLAACGFHPYNENASPDILNFSPNVSIDYINEVIDYTNTITPNGKPVDLRGYTIRIEDTYDDTTETCNTKHTPGEIDLGCTFVDMRFMSVSWDERGKKIPEGYHAATITHEMGHIYYYQRTGDADVNHKHMEWFVDIYEESINHFNSAGFNDPLQQ
jgi:hypothetical protein